MAKPKTNMKKRNREAPIPRARDKTVRQELIGLLQTSRLTVSELSRTTGNSEREITQQLSQLAKATALSMEPPTCLKCGFVFTNRERPKKPGKCPQCRSTRITEPAFFIKH